MPGRLAHRAPLLVALALWLLTSAPVRADVAVMVPPHADEEVGTRYLDEAVEELTRLLKLKGFDVISAGQAGPAAEAEQQRGAFPKHYDPLYCLTPECSNEYRKLFDATFAVQLSLASRGIRPAAVSVTLTEGPKAFFKGSAPVEGNDIRSAVRLAFEAARTHQEEGAGPWLSVIGTPEGALVYVDNSEYGRVPFTKRHIDPGSHQVEVRADDYRSETRYVDVPARIDHVEVVSVGLESENPQVAAPAPERAPRPKRRWSSSAWDWGLGGTITGLSTAHLIAGLVQKGREGECASHDELGRCTELYGQGSGASRANLLIGFGAAGVALGALTIGLGPIGRLQARGTRDSARLELKGAF